MSPAPSQDPKAASVGMSNAFRRFTPPKTRDLEWNRIATLADILHHEITVDRRNLTASVHSTTPHVTDAALIMSLLASMDAA